MFRMAGKQMGHSHEKVNESHQTLSFCKEKIKVQIIYKQSRNPDF